MIKFGLFVFLSLLLSHPAFAIDCTQKPNQKKYKTICRNVIDPVKFKTGEVSKINCTDDETGTDSIHVEDGYSMQICEKVNLSQQLKMRSNH